MLLTPTRQREQCELVFPNLDEWIELYLADCRRQLRKPKTITHYSNALKRFSIWYRICLPNGRLCRSQTRDFIHWLSEEKGKYDDHPGRPTEEAGLSPVTVRRTVGVIRTFFRWLYQEEYLPRDLSYWFPLPKAKLKPSRVMEMETLSAMLQATAGGEMPVRDLALLSLLADTGLRRQEVALLTVKQVCWLGSGDRGYLHNVRGKGDKFRSVPFSAVAGSALRQWLAQREGILDTRPPAATLFVQKTGEPLTEVGIYQVLRRTAKRAGVEDAVWNTHSLRHNFATYFWRTQRDTKTLSTILGHSSQKVTEDIYVHPVPDDLLEAHTSALAAGVVMLPDVSDGQIQHPPTREELRQAILANPNWVQLGMQFGLSDQGVRKLANRYGLLAEYYAARRGK